MRDLVQVEVPVLGEAATHLFAGSNSGGKKIRATMVLPMLRRSFDCLDGWAAPATVTPNMDASVHHASQGRLTVVVVSITREIESFVSP